MNKYNDKYLHTVTILIIVLVILTSAIGLLYKAGGLHFIPKLIWG